MQTMNKPQTTDGEQIRRTLAKRSFATLATSSPSGRPHVAGVLYKLVDDGLYISTLRSSRKARNIAANGHAALSVPVRRLPIGPPSTIQFQTTATLLAPTDPTIVDLVADGRLKSLTSHGELDLPDGCFVRVDLPRRLITYGLGMPLRKLIADPLNAGGHTQLT